MSIAARTARKRVLRDHVGRPLSWRQAIALERLHELRTIEGEVVGTLRWEKELRSFAVAECSKGAWTFERRGVLQSRVVVRERGSEAELAALGMNWRGGGALQVSGGRRYHWSNTSLWNSSWAFSTDSGELLLRVSSKPALARPHAVVTVEPGAASLPDLDLLVLLSGYLLILVSDDLAAVLAAAVS
jgi:hypothetical protein